jgi:hypothetical protein
MQTSIYILRCSRSDIIIPDLLRGKCGLKKVVDSINLHRNCNIMQKYWEESSYSQVCVSDENKLYTSLEDCATIPIKMLQKIY